MAALGSGSQEDVYPLKGLGTGKCKTCGRGAEGGRHHGGHGDERDENDEAIDRDEERGEVGAEREERGVAQVVGGRWEGGVYSTH